MDVLPAAWDRIVAALFIVLTGDEGLRQYWRQHNPLAHTVSSH